MMSPEKYRSLVENLNEILYILNTRAVIEYVTPNVKVLGGYSESELIGKSFLNFVHPDDKAGRIDQFKKILSGSNEATEYRFLTKDGRQIWVRTSARPVIEDGRVTGVQGVLTDISDIKRAEEIIRDNLKEKEILLSEIHHRVKSNMAVISSLLSLQSEFISSKKDPEVLLNDTLNRIQSMAMVHELVYEHNNFIEIRFDHLLHRLVDSLKKIYTGYQREITVDIQTDDIMLDLNESVPLSLFANEVISNAFKHAFNGMDSGTIAIVFERQNEGFRIIVQDDGCGVSDISKMQNPESFGCTIIHGLVKQLQGRISFMNRKKGLKVEASFPQRKHTRDDVRLMESL